MKTQRVATPGRPDAGRPRHTQARRPTVADSWAAMPWSLRILRAFLGITFVYAGMNKFLDPNVLHHGGVHYIGSQLSSFAHGTPMAPLMRLLATHPVLVGIGIGLTELVVGLGTLLGVGMLLLGLVGFAINLTLWLSFTWHVHPYFLGSDSIYAVAWAALCLGIWEMERARFGGAVPGLAARVDGLGRREFLRAGTVGALSIVMGVFGLAFAGSPTKNVGLGRLTPSTGGSGNRAAGGATTGSTGPSAAPAGPPAPTVNGRGIATLSELPVGRAIGFGGPAGTPGALVRLADGSVVAYSRICTHAGCEVGYDSGPRLLVCPCHGAEFDPANHGEPLPGGPTSIPLPAIKVVLDRATDQVILPTRR